MLLGYPSSKYSGQLRKTGGCLKYKTGYVRLPVEKDEYNLPPGVQQFYYLPEDLKLFREQAVNYPCMFVLGVKDMVSKTPILGLLEFNPDEYYNSHTIVTRYMEKRNQGEFIIVMSGELLWNGTNVLFSDDSGHFYMYFIEELEKTIGKEAYVPYITERLQPLIQACFSGIPTVFRKHGTFKIYAGGEDPDSQETANIYVPRLRSRVCSLGSKAREYFVYPDKETCTANTFHGPNFCSGDTEMTQKIQAARKQKQASGNVLLQNTRTKQLADKALAKNITDSELVELLKLTDLPAMPVSAGVKGTLIGRALRKLGIKP